MLLYTCIYIYTCILLYIYNSHVMGGFKGTLTENHGFSNPGKKLRGGAKGRWGHISQQLFALILFQYRTFPSLGASQFPAFISLHWPLHHFLRFCCCNIRTSPASTTSCMHLVSISNFHPPCAIVSNKNHKQDNVSQFVGQLCELEGPRCLNRWTLGWGTLRVGIGL